MNNNNIQKAIIYCRVSSEKQVREGNGLSSQEHRCKEYAANHGYIVEAVFKEEAISGKMLNRPEMQKLLRFLEDNNPDPYIVIIDSLDRMARNVEAHWKLKRAFETRGGTVESPNFNFENSPEGRMIENTLAGVAQYQLESNARQVSQKMKAKKEIGCWCLAPPTGMHFVDHPIYKRLLSPIPEQAIVLKEAIEGFANNRFVTQSNVQAFLEKHKYIFNKKKIHLEFVKRILTKILYAGYLEYLPWGVSRRKAMHEGFIDITTYDKVQKKLKKGERKLHKTDTLTFPLRRIVLCSICGKQMTGSRNKGKSKYYNNYTCNNRSCSAKPKNIQKHILEAAYIKMLKELSPQSDLIKLTKAIAIDAWNNTANDTKSSHQRAETQIKAFEKSIDHCLENILKTNNEAMKKRYETKIDQLSKEIEVLNKPISKKPILNFDMAISEVLYFVGTPWEYWENADPERKSIIHSMVFIERPSYNSQDGFGTPEVSLPFQLKRLFEKQEKCLVEMPGVEPGSKDRNGKRLQS